MQIHVSRNGQELGAYSVEVINSKLADGTLLPTDQARYEGASSSAPLSTIPGVTAVAGRTASVPPVPPATGAFAASSSAPRPPAAPLARSYTGFAVASWLLLGLTALVALVPVIGFATWLMAIIVIPLAIVFAIIILSRGGKGQGIFLIVAAVGLMPVFLLVAPVVSTLLLGASVSAEEKAQETQVMNNLRKLSHVKAQWATKSNAADGTVVTMAELMTDLGGRELNSIVGEKYDPMPVGQAPTATLPADKSLALHKKGEVIKAGPEPPVAQ